MLEWKCCDPHAPSIPTTQLPEDPPNPRTQASERNAWVTQKTGVSAGAGCPNGAVDWPYPHVHGLPRSTLLEAGSGS